MHPFKVGSTYSRKDVLAVVGLPDYGGGDWYTGYTRLGDDHFIFCGIGTPGRTGHDYKNHFVGDDLVWFGKERTTLSQPAIQRLLSGAGDTYVFYREDDRAPFTFAGVAKPKTVKDVSPVEVLWSFADDTNGHAEILPEEISETEHVVEGAKKSITVNVYERDPNARRKCIERWGVSCVVCGFDFAKTFGAVGEGYIHVHHLKPLSEIGEQYTLSPTEDLRPVCPNCHAMLHRRKPAFSIEELRAVLGDRTG